MKIGEERGLAFDIDLMLRAQRGRMRTRIAELAAINYQGFYSALIDVLHGYGVKNLPDLRVVSSVHSLTEMIGNGSHRWIVYDQHLGQIFARLSALIDQRAPFASIDTYLTKLYAGRLLVHGRTHEAFLTALAHQVLRADDPFRADVRDETRHRRVAAEEVFVLAHELMHVVFAEHPALASTLREFYFGLCEAEESDREDRYTLDPETMAGMLADDYNREWVRRHGDIDQTVLDSGRAELIAHFLDQIAHSRLPGINELRDDHALAEELVCDAGAAVLAVQVLGDGTAESALMILTAAFDANQKLRLIAHMDGNITGQQTIGGVNVNSTIRGSRLRQFYRALYESHLTEIALGFAPTPGDHESMLASITATNEQFYATIFDQLTTGSFYQRFSGLLDKGTTRRLASELPSLVDCWSQTAAILGFDEE